MNRDRCSLSGPVCTSWLMSAFAQSIFAEGNLLSKFCFAVHSFLATAGPSGTVALIVCFALHVHLHWNHAPVS